MPPACGRPIWERRSAACPPALDGTATIGDAGNACGEATLVRAELCVRAARRGSLRTSTPHSTNGCDRDSASMRRGSTLSSTPQNPSSRSRMAGGAKAPACELGGHVPPSHGTGQSCVYGRPSALILWTALVLLSRIDRVDGTSAVTTCSPSPCKASCGPSRFHFAAYSISAESMEMQTFSFRSDAREGQCRPKS